MEGVKIDTAEEGMLLQLLVSARPGTESLGGVEDLQKVSRKLLGGGHQHLLHQVLRVRREVVREGELSLANELEGLVCRRPLEGRLP